MRTNQLLIRVSSSWTAYEALTSFYLIAFALQYDASNTMVGLLGALPFLAMLVAEFPGVRLVEARSRKLVASLTSMLPRLLWILIAVLPLLSDHPVMAIAIIYFVLRVIEYLGDPAWTSMVGDLVKEKSRGSFFGQRFR